MCIYIYMYNNTLYICICMPMTVHIHVPDMYMYIYMCSYITENGCPAPHIRTQSPAPWDERHELCLLHS